MIDARLAGRAAPLLLLFATACGDEVPAIVGDWFHCTTVDCGVLGIKGSRFEAGGALLHLYPEKPALGDADGYCHTTSPDLRRTYAYQGEALTVHEPAGGSFSYVFVIEGDQARATREGKTQYLKRVDPPRDRGSCSARSPWVCPRGQKDGTASTCQARWTCDNGRFEVKCAKSGAALACRCLDAGVEKKTFTSKGLCSLFDLSALISEVNAGCGWKLSLPL